MYLHMQRHCACTRFLPLSAITMVATTACALVLLATISQGAIAYAEIKEFGLTESAYDMGDSPDIRFSFTGEIVAGDSGPVYVFVAYGNKDTVILADPNVGSDNVFVTNPRLVSDIFSAPGEYTATAITHDQKREDGITIPLEFKDNVLYTEPDFDLRISNIPDKTTREGEQVSLRVTVTDGSIDGVKYKLVGAVQRGASIDSDTGVFTWTPGERMGTTNGAMYSFEVSASKIPLSDTAKFTIIVKKAAESKDTQSSSPSSSSSSSTSSSEPDPRPTAVRSSDTRTTLAVPANFVERGVNPQSYVDRYNNQPSFQDWFDEHYSQYDSIYHAVGLPEVPASFVDETEDPQNYVDRYNNQPSFQDWFDEHYSQYDSIHHAVGLPEPGMPDEKAASGDTDAASAPPAEPIDTEPEPIPVRELPRLDVPLADFVDAAQDPMTYVERYNTDDTYKAWFDEHYIDEYGTIYRAVGLLDVPASFVDASADPQSYVDRYDTDDAYKAWFDENYSEYLSIYHAVGLPEPDAAEQAPEAAEPQLPPPVVAPGAVVPAGLTLQPGQEFGECGEGTELVDNYCVIIGTKPPAAAAAAAASADDTEEKDEKSSSGGLFGGGCLIATAAYGSELAPQVQMLREIRDSNLMQTNMGSSFVAGFNTVYYSFSPHVADAEREHPALRYMIMNLLAPMLHTLSVMEHADTESKVLAYGIAVILGNIMMYVGAPVLYASLMYRYVARKSVHSATCRQEEDNAQ